jgi:hypothetical protein
MTNYKSCIGVLPDASQSPTATKFWPSFSVRWNFLTIPFDQRSLLQALGGV